MVCATIYQTGRTTLSVSLIRNGLKQRGRFIDVALQRCFIVCHYEGSGKPGCLENK